MRKVLVVAPHPDDETLGCGGTLLKHRQAGDELHWLLVTGMSLELGYSEQRIAQRELEIEAVARCYGFRETHRLGFPAARLDTVARSDLIEKVAAVFKRVQPELVYVPFRGDVHSDHAAAADAALSCCKWFRHRSIKRVLAYETLSETEFGLHADSQGFQPNVFVDIGAHLEQKLEILRLFENEISEFPFPRSLTAVKALAQYRGATTGCNAAEAFMLLREII